jgi:hypothetical protein
MNKSPKNNSGVDLGMYRAWNGHIHCVIAVDPALETDNQDDMVVTYMDYKGTLSETTQKDWLSNVELRVGDISFGPFDDYNTVPKYRKITGWNFMRGSGTIDHVSPRLDK